MDHSTTQLHYSLNLGGITIPCTFTFPDCARFFGSYCTGPVPGPGSVAISQLFWDDWVRHIGPKNAYSEYSAFASVASQALLDFNRCVIHAAAIRWRHRAYLIAAPSGVGKSTQVKTLEALYPGGFAVISGDRPILELREDGSVIAHPSPWNGKEGWCGAEAAPVAALILLERGEKNAMQLLSARQAAGQVFSALLQASESEANIRKVAAFESALLQRVPVWHMVNAGVPDSTRMLYETVMQGGAE